MTKGRVARGARRHAAGPAAWLALAASLAAATTAEAGVARRGEVVMGTVLTVTVIAASDAAADALARAAIEEAARQDDALTIWRPQGELARLNANAGGGAVAVSERLRRGLAAMISLAAATGGAFQPAFVPETDGERGSRRRFADISRVLQLETDETPAGEAAPTAARARARLEASAVLDPGAIGKGLALDAAAALLARDGAEAAFLDFGGSSQTALGAPPGEAGWKVVVSALAAGQSHGVVFLRDASLSTSRAGATDTAPIYDPRSGLAVTGPRLVTVLAKSATAADAWSTALVVMGGREAAARAEAADLEALVEEPSGLSLTSGLRALLD